MEREVFYIDEAQLGVLTDMTREEIDRLVHRVAEWLSARFGVDVRVHDTYNGAPELGSLGSDAPWEEGDWLEALEWALSRKRALPRRKPLTPEALRAAREGLGLTQEDLAQALGVTRQAVGLWETGRRPVPVWLELALDGLRAKQEMQAGRVEALR